MSDQRAGIHSHRPSGRAMPVPPTVRTGRWRPMAAALVSLAVATSGCAASSGAASSNAPSRAAPSATAPGQTAPGQTAAQSAPEQSAPKQSAVSQPALPDPKATIPKDPAKLARSLTSTVAELRRATDAWIRDGDPGKGQPPSRWCCWPCNSSAYTATWPATRRSRPAPTPSCRSPWPRRRRTT